MEKMIKGLEWTCALYLTQSAQKVRFFYAFLYMHKNCLLVHVKTCLAELNHNTSMIYNNKLNIRT
ncbi:hypothetical protein HanRHA438_Chr04g0179671 [Helianthus annuus]|nr:hypothetical protein HanRHA438_Chr04g0179671 [Helianthus annuus]